MNTRGKTEAVDYPREGWPVADMSGANLKGALLRRANLANATMRGANLRESNLQGANLRKATLCEADLKGADLGGANLGMADLRSTCLEQANLCRVNLNRANLLGARLAGARLDHVDLANAILPDGTHYTEETILERFTDVENPAFTATLKAITAMDAQGCAAKQRERGDGDLSWAQFVERTYGSLAHDPIEWDPPVYTENEDARE